MPTRLCLVIDTELIGLAEQGWQDLKRACLGPVIGSIIGPCELAVVLFGGPDR